MECAHRELKLVCNYVRNILMSLKNVGRIIIKAATDDDSDVYATFHYSMLYIVLVSSKINVFMLSLLFNIANKKYSTLLE